jgi:ankyrin repeat protein
MTTVFHLNVFPVIVDRLVDACSIEKSVCLYYTSCLTHICQFGNNEAFFERSAALNNANKFCDILRTVEFRNGKLKTCVSSQKKALIFLFVTPKTTVLFYWGVALNKANKYDNTPVIVDVRNGKYEVFRFLKEIHAYINIRYTKINTNLHWTTESNSVNVMKILWGKESSVNLTNTDDFFIYMFQLKLVICVQGKLLLK